MPSSPAPPGWPRSQPAQARPTATGWIAGATARSTPPSIASPSPAPAATQKHATTSPARRPKERPPAKPSAASNATSPAASGNSSARPTPDKEHRHHHYFLDIGAAQGAVPAHQGAAPASRRKDKPRSGLEGAAS